MKGRFITFEGPEGGGKTTQARRLIARLEAMGVCTRYTREPGGTPTGEAIRAILQYDEAGEPVAPEAEVLLFAASRAQLVRRVIRPALEQGDWVICDRFADSTTVYQGYGRGFPIDRVEAINRFAIGETIPDRTFLLDLDVEAGFERLARRAERGGRSADRMEREDREFHRRVREGYLTLARAEPARFRVINAALGEEEVAARVWEALSDVLP